MVAPISAVSILKSYRRLDLGNERLRKDTDVQHDHSKHKRQCEAANRLKKNRRKETKTIQNIIH